MHNDRLITLTVTYIHPGHTLQKRALSIMYHMPFRTSVSEIFSTATLLTVYQIPFQQIAMMMHKIVFEKKCTLNIIEYSKNTHTLGLTLENN